MTVLERGDDERALRLRLFVESAEERARMGAAGARCCELRTRTRGRGGRDTPLCTKLVKGGHELVLRLGVVIRC